MTVPTPEQRDRMAAFYDFLGVPMIDHYDREQLLDTNRESRRCNALSAPDRHRAMETLAAGMYAQMKADVPVTDWDQVVDVLLAVAGYLSSFAASGVDPMAIVSTITYLADDLATEEAK